MQNLRLRKCICQFASIAIQSTQIGCLNNINYFFPSSGDWEFKIKVLASLVSLEAFFLSLQVTTFSFCPHMTFPLCACPPGVSFSSYQNNSDIELWPTLITFELDYLFKGPISKCNHILRYQRLGFQCMNFRGIQVCPQQQS